VDAVHGANIDAGGIFGADAGLGDYVGHLQLLVRMRRLVGRFFCLPACAFAADGEFWLPLRCLGQLLLIVRDEGTILNWTEVEVVSQFARDTISSRLKT
jgi:hypothetical protein